MKLLVDRFWEKVCKTKSCWLWTAYKDAFGYGRINAFGRVQKAHRVAWALTNGAIPEGLCVLHHCDNPSCVNPKHLFLGTYLDNAQDREAKGRGQREFTCHLTKLSGAQAIEIRRLRAEKKLKHRELAALFNVRYQSIQAILYRKSHKRAEEFVEAA